MIALKSRKAVSELLSTGTRFASQQKKRESWGFCTATGCALTATASTECQCHACGWALAALYRSVSVCLLERGRYPGLFVCR